MKKILLALLILVLPSVGETEKRIPNVLNLVAIDGFLALTDAEVKEVYKRAAYYFKELGVGFKLKYVRDETNPCSQLHSLATWIDELKCLRWNAQDRGFVPNRMRMVTYYMIPPWVTVGQPGGPQTAWLGGVAFTICGDFAIGNGLSVALKDGLLGESRIDHSATVLAHEVAHLLCATHKSVPLNLMHPDANSYTSAFEGKLPVLRATKREIKKAWRRARK